MTTPIITQAPAIVNLSFLPGDTVSFDVNITDSQGQPVNIHGNTITAFILSETIQYDFTVTIVSETLGQTHLELSKDDSLQIIDGSQWRYVIVNADLEQLTYLLGTVKLQQL